MKRINTILIAIILACSGIAKAQTSEEKLTNPIQISIITPLGTNGMDSWNTTNHISLNLIAGYNGGLEGIELGGFLNILNGNMTGIQLAGFGNNNLAESKGIELAGFYNLNAGYSEAVEIAGYLNLNLAAMKGIQASGFANATLGTFDGIQLSGFGNYVAQETKAFQGAGFANINRKKSQGIQLAGFANINGADSKAIQAAGFSNITNGNLTGLQVAGFVNVAKKVKGTQIGFINFADSIENGLAIGFLSFIKHGYHVFEVGFGETLNTTLSYKTGTKRFYNIISVGAGIKNDEFIYGWGYGIGTIVPVNPRLEINLDLISYQLHDDTWFDRYPNMLNKLHIQANYSLSGHFSVYGGPAINMLMSDSRSSSVSSPFTHISWNWYNKTHRHTRIIWYPGFTAGFRF